MDLVKLHQIAKEIVKKTRVPKDGWTTKDLKIVNAHTTLWWEMLCDAFGVEEE